MTEKFFVGLGKLTAVLVGAAVFNLVLAFPVEWAWNYAVTAVFHAPPITWGQAWCLMFLSATLVKSILIEKD